MACHEVAALRLGLMNVLGESDAAEREHELAELGPKAREPGPLRALSEASDLASVLKLYEAAVGDLTARIATTAPDDPKLAYGRALVILTKKVELDLRAHVDALTRLGRELDEMHDFVHEVFPVS